MCDTIEIVKSQKHILNTSVRFYTIWSLIKSRCLNEKNPVFYNYGGKGIKVCDRWNRFELFKDDMYELYKIHIKDFGESQTSIDRLDSNGNYTKNNCRWATRKEQGENRGNRILSLGKRNRWKSPLHFTSSLIY